MRITSFDDEADFLLILDHILGHGFPTARLTSFQSPRLAFEHIHTHGTDFIVTGGMSGPDLVRVLRVHGVDVPIVMISGNPNFRSEAFEVGASDFLDKAHLEELPGIIRSYLTREISA
jgi:DNA-binding LytR/AlgR family response regulator